MSRQTPDDILTNAFGDVIFSYTRAEAIADGVLVDATELARDAGFLHPVAITAAAWADCIAWTTADSEQQVPQDQTGRLWDVLWMAICAISGARAPGNVLRFDLYRVPRDGRATEAVPVTLKVMVGPGDHGEPVVTIMQPSED